MDAKSKRIARVLIVSAAAALAALVLVSFGPDKGSPPIRIGVLYSLSGPMAVSERSAVDAVRLGVEEINARGGLLGRRVEIVLADGRADARVFAEEAERLIEREKVSALFACWTTTCRGAVMPVVERHQHLMFYPLRHEGLELSPHILYTGSAPNQQVIPGARWAMDKLGRRIYLATSDHKFSRTAALIVRDHVTATGGEIVSEGELARGSKDAAAIVADIRRLKPDVVLNLLVGERNAVFFSALEDAGMADLPLLSFSLAECEMKTWGGYRLNQHYAVWSYFQSLPREENRRFVAAYRARFGADRMVGDPAEASYVSLHLWAQAVEAVGSADPRRVNSATLLRQSFNGPSEVAAVDAATRHLWKMVRIGKVRPDGEFDQVFASSAPLRPAPWPFYRSSEAWQALEEREAGSPP